MEERTYTNDASRVSMSASQSEQNLAAPGIGQSAPVLRPHRSLGNSLSPSICDNSSYSSQRQLNSARPSSRRSRSPSFVSPVATPSTSSSATVYAAALAAANITPTSNRRRRNAIDSTNPRVNPFWDPSNLPAVQPATPNLPRSAIIAAQTGPARFRADPRRLEKPPFQQPFNSGSPTKTHLVPPPQFQLPYGADFSNYTSSSSSPSVSNPAKDSDVIAFPEYDESLISDNLSFSGSPSSSHKANPRSSPSLNEDTLAALPHTNYSRSRHSSPTPSSTPPRRPRAGTRDAGSPYRTLPPLERPRLG